MVHSPVNCLLSAELALADNDFKTAQAEFDEFLEHNDPTHLSDQVKKLYDRVAVALKTQF